MPLDFCKCDMKLTSPCNCWKNPEFVKHRAEIVIGILAYTIRCDWSDFGNTYDKLDSIRDIAEKYYRYESHKDLVKWIDKHYKDVLSDGRSMREWPGPYYDFCNENGFQITRQDEIFFDDNNLMRYVNEVQ